MRKNALLALLALFVPIALLAAGCGDDDDSGDDSTEQTDDANDSNDDASDDASDDSNDVEDIEEPENREEAIDLFSEQLAADGTLTEDQAECVAEYVIDEVGFDRMREAGFTEEEVPADLQTDLQQALLDSFEDCNVTLPTG
jgi:hypothetical protein